MKDTFNSINDPFKFEYEKFVTFSIPNKMPDAVILDDLPRDLKDIIFVPKLAFNDQISKEGNLIF